MMKKILILMILGAFHNTSAKAYLLHYDCTYWGNKVRSQIKKKKEIYPWEIRLSYSICSRYAYKAYLEIADKNYTSQQMRLASKINNPYTLLAWKKIAHKTDAKGWELPLIVKVKTLFSLYAITKILHEKKYSWWQLKWATQINNRFAWYAFDYLTDRKPYFEKELKWVPYIHTRQEWITFIETISQPHTSKELQKVVSIDD